MTRNQLTVGVGAVLALLLVWNTVAVVRLDTRVRALESRGGGHAAAQTSKGPRSLWPGEGGNWQGPDARRRPRPVGSQPPADDSVAAQGIDLDDPAIRKQLEQIASDDRKARREERAKRFREAMHAQIDRFAEEKGLDAATAEKVVAEVDALQDGVQAVRRDIDSGDLTWTDARKEIQAQRQDTRANLQQILGDDLAGDLEHRLYPRRAGPSGSPDAEENP